MRAVWHPGRPDERSAICRIPGVTAKSQFADRTAGPTSDTLAATGADKATGENTMSIQWISNEELMDVVGGVGDKCRLAVTAAGAGMGAVIGAQGAANPIGAMSTTFAGFANTTGEFAAGRPGQGVIDAATAGAAMIPGPLGGVAGAYTHGKNAWNASRTLCK